MPTINRKYLTTVAQYTTNLLKPKPKEKHDGYASNKWKTYSYSVRARNPKCSDCNNIFKPQDLAVDHIIPVNFGGSFWDIRNHVVLCHKCHNKKTGKEKKAPINRTQLNDTNELIPLI